MNKLSDKYLIIDSSVVMNKIQDTLNKQGVNHSMLKHAGAGTKEYYEFRLNLGNFGLAGDTVTPRIIHINSYNGECANLTTAGFIRWVCSNGMVAGSDWFTQRIIHVQGQTAERKLKELEYQIAATLDYIIYELPADVQRLADTKLDTNKMIDIVGSLNIAKGNKDWAINKIVNIDYRREADRANNLWTLWNIVNEGIGRKYKSESAFIQRNLKLIDDIELLAA